jgi:hypothetical protein
MKNCGELERIVLDSIGDFAKICAAEKWNQSKSYLWSQLQIQYFACRIIYLKKLWLLRLRYV